MLNELYLIERSLTARGVAVAESHPDIKLVGNASPWRVRLSADGSIVRVQAVEKGLGLWMLRDGQKNSFPFVKLNNSKNLPIEQWAEAWPDNALRDRVAQRLAQLSSLEGGEDSPVVCLFQRFLAALSAGRNIMAEICDRSELKEANEDWIAVATRLVATGKSTLYFDIDDDDFDRDAGDIRHIPAISAVLAISGKGDTGTCWLTGGSATIHRGNFPEPNLPGLGQTKLFARNTDIAAAYRYGHAGDQAFDIGADTAKRLAGGLAHITAPDGKGKTWQLVPSEKPKESDLLIAFLPENTDIPLTGVVAGPDAAAQLLIGYEAATERALEELSGQVAHRLPKSAVQICILRKVDVGNRKILYHRTVAVDKLHDCAVAWRRGARNVPASIRMSIAGKKGEKSVQATPPPIAPLFLPRLTRRAYVAGGTRQVDVIGVSASEAFAMFLGEGNVKRWAGRILRLALERHGALLSGFAHAWRRYSLTSEMKRFDREIALCAVALLGVVLDKLNRPKEVYMNEEAFKLGQLLAVMDTIHIGYCADVRGGAVPPTLLGNAVLTMAQTSPLKALALTCARYKPYAAWVRQRKPASDSGAEGEKPSERNRAVLINVARKNARHVSGLCAELHGKFNEKSGRTDAFRAELLLGYLAGPSTAPDENSETKPADDKDGRK